MSTQRDDGSDGAKNARKTRKPVTPASTDETVVDASTPAARTDAPSDNPTPAAPTDNSTPAPAPQQIDLPAAALTASDPASGDNTIAEAHTMPKRITRPSGPAPRVFDPTLFQRMRHGLNQPNWRTSPAHKTLTDLLRSEVWAERLQVLSWIPRNDLTRPDVTAVVWASDIDGWERITEEALEDLPFRLQAAPIPADRTYLTFAENLAGLHVDRLEPLRDTDPDIRAMAARSFGGSDWAINVCRATVRAARPHMSPASQELAAQHALSDALMFLADNPLPAAMTPGEFLRWRADGRGHAPPAPVDGPRPRPYNLKRMEVDNRRENETGTPTDIKAARERADRVFRTAGGTAAFDKFVFELIEAGPDVAVGGRKWMKTADLDRAVYVEILERYAFLRAAEQEADIAEETLTRLEYRLLGLPASHKELLDALYACRGVTADEAVRLAENTRPEVVRAVHGVLRNLLGGRGMSASLAADVTRTGQFGVVLPPQVDECLRRIRYRVRTARGEGPPPDDSDTDTDSENLNE